MANADTIFPGSDRVARTHCIRCGTCCLKGGPTLHRQDSRLVAEGILRKSHLYTLRKGEAVRDIDDTLKVLEGEIIKIKGRANSWTCMFYDEDLRACLIYQHRPAECRALKCWDLREFREVMATPRLQRRDLINPDDRILKVIGVHEQRCAYGVLESAVRRLAGPDSDKAVEMILDLLQYDHYLRPLLTQKLNMAPGAMDFFFGRALTTTIAMFGLCIRREGDSFVLMPTAPQTS